MENFSFLQDGDFPNGENFPDWHCGAMRKPSKSLLSPEMSRERVSLRLRALREALDISQSQFADAIGHDRSSYSKVESGKEGLSLRYAQIMCDLYGIGLDFIYRGDFRDLPDNLASKVRGAVFLQKP
ncbi:helix-turn-helix transcriptional regulator [Oceanicella sp. SM1341]|uniref:helix-turn-helix transcriptional regulator n=1 Tax=Oceanicella sp. SM1341 TaxID=1548889 RepID=UPI0013002BE5|nr:helix-turn-helix transcriptional regulator [Oceanicella sp. SM1341]